MSTLEALYFPGTEIYSGSQFPVFLLFNKVHLLQPVEEEAVPGDTADIFATHGLCQAHTPVPLGENRDRFLRLIRDIKDRKDDYAAQLSALTVASLSQKKNSLDDSHHGIISSLLGSQGVQKEPERKTDVDLWQTRLVLKISEILDREEEEVAMQMALLDDEEGDLFKVLQGELDEEEESLLEELTQLRENLSRPTSSSIKNRLSAWSKLYRAGAVPAHPIWLTHIDEAGDSLLEKYQETVNLAPALLVSFALPANIGWAREDVLETAARFSKCHQELLGKIRTALELKDSAGLQDLAAQWSQILEADFPAADHGRTTLEFYTIADKACDALIGAAAHNSGALLGIVRWQQ